MSRTVAEELGIDLSSRKWESCSNGFSPVCYLANRSSRRLPSAPTLFSCPPVCATRMRCSAQAGRRNF